jgi:hypothetical protein
MGIHFEWHDAKKVATIPVEAPWTWNDLKTVIDYAYDEIQAVGYPVAIIADLRRMGQLPAGNLLRHLQYSQAHTAKNVYATVIVGAPYVITTFVNIVMKVRPDSSALVLFAQSVDEAKALLQQHPPTAGARTGTNRQG